MHGERGRDRTPGPRGTDRGTDRGVDAGPRERPAGPPPDGGVNPR